MISLFFYIYFSTVLEKGGKNSLIIYRPRKSFLQNPLPSSAFLLVHFFGAGSGRGTRLKTTFSGISFKNSKTVQTSFAIRSLDKIKKSS